MVAKQTVTGFAFALDAAAVSPAVVGCAIVKFAGFIRTAEYGIRIGVDADAVAYQTGVFRASFAAFHVDGIEAVAILLRLIA